MRSELDNTYWTWSSKLGIVSMNTLTVDESLEKHTL